ncbi:MAG: creatininase family protein [Chloroflexi bacterium]|nr:creatininase family protein [Chloroflexota bacterium]
MDELSLLDIPWVDAQRLLEEAHGVVLMAIGATEGHGHHCPLGTDALIADAVVKRAARKARVPYAPSIPVGVSPQHLEGRPGTLTVREHVYVEFLRDLCRSLIHHGWTKLVVVNNHEGNTPAIWALMRRVKYETGALFVGVDLAGLMRTMLDDIVENPPGELPQWHASEVETANILAIDSAMARMERAQMELPHTPQAVADSPKFVQDSGFSKTIKFAGYSVLLPQENADYSHTGTVGNPLRATAEKGGRILERFSDYVADLACELKKVQVQVRAREFVDRM